MRARAVLRKEIAALHRQLLMIARSDEVCRHLTTVPGVGALTALTFKTAVDDPTRFTSSKRLGAHFGLTPRKYQSGTIDVTGSIDRSRRRHGPQRPLRSGAFHAHAREELLQSETLGDGGCQTPRSCGVLRWHWPGSWQSFCTACG